MKIKSMLAVNAQLFTLAILAFLLVPVINGQTTARMDDLETHYDKFDDKTTAWVSYTRIDLSSFANQTLSITAFFTYRGKRVGTPVQGMGLIFSSNARSHTYLRQNSLIALVDNERLSFEPPFTRYPEISIANNNVRVDEVLEFEITYQVLKKIAYARHVDMRLGSTEFSLPSVFHNSLKRLLSHLTLPPSSRSAKNSPER